MAATGFTPISLYHTTTALAVPVNTNLVAGELALNITDGKLYYNDGGTVKLLASNASTTAVNTLSFGTTGLTPATATSGAITVAGTLATTNGGTGLTSFTSNGVFYAGSTSAVNQSANLTFNGTTLTANTIGAFTLGGTIAGGGNQINNVIIGTSTPLAGSFTAVTATSIFDSGNLTFTGTGNRITGDFSNATVANRVMFQSSTTNGATEITAIPNGTSVNGSVAALNNTDPTNAGRIRIGLTDTISYLDSGRLGTGTYLPMTFYTGGSERMRISTAGLTGFGTASATSMLQTAGSSSVSALKTPNIAEVDTIAANAATGTINYDITTQSVLFYTSNASGNWTVNFRGSSGTTLDAVMQTGECISATFLVTQGATAYYNSAVTIDGASVTPKWQGGTAPTSGNASSVDCYTYVIQKTGSATYAVLASQTKFA